MIRQKEKEELERKKQAIKAKQEHDSKKSLRAL